VILSHYSPPARRCGRGCRRAAARRHVPPPRRRRRHGRSRAAVRRGWPRGRAQRGQARPSSLRPPTRHARVAGGAPRPRRRARGRRHRGAGVGGGAPGGGRGGSLPPSRSVCWGERWGGPRPPRWHLMPRVDGGVTHIGGGDRGSCEGDGGGHVGRVGRISGGDGNASRRTRGGGGGARRGMLARETGACRFGGWSGRRRGRSGGCGRHAPVTCRCSRGWHLPPDLQCVLRGV